MIIYSTRHGETEWNVLDKISGITEVNLTEKGIAQAKELANRVLTECEHIDVIIVSPMKRAQLTASFTAKLLDIDIITDVRLREWDYGLFEGKHRDTKGYKEAKLEFGCKMPGGESVFDLVARVYSLLDDVKEKYKGKNVLLVSHGGVCRIIDAYFNEMSKERFANFFMGNCELLKYEI